MLTPVEKHGDIWVKRDDLFSIAGVSGGKVRTCWHLAQQATEGLVTAGSRASPQVNIVAHIAKHRGLPCRVHVPTGALSPELVQAKRAGAEIIQHRAGYNSVLVARAREDAKSRGWTNVPFGMECLEAVRQTASQVPSLLNTGVRRIVIPVGSGMSLCGVLQGIEDLGLWGRLTVCGIVVGADPMRRLLTFGPRNDAFGSTGLGESRIPEYLADQRLILTRAPTDYHVPVSAKIGDLSLDPHYEAKCHSFLIPGDLLWIVGVRQSLVSPES